MAGKRQPPKYLVMLATGDLEFDSVQAAINNAVHGREMHPEHTFYIVQKLATVAPEDSTPTHKISRHY